MTFTPQTSAHITFKGELQGKAMKIMVDCGSNRNYASIRVGQLLKK
jgi:hypothetical protein